MAIYIKNDGTSIDLIVDTVNGDNMKQMLVTVWLDTKGKPATVGIGCWRLSPEQLQELTDKVINLQLIDRRA